ncbi:hypothetical protein C5167_045032, partial [Papaver somniferum]
METERQRSPVVISHQAFEIKFQILRLSIISVMQIRRSLRSLLQLKMEVGQASKFIHRLRYGRIADVIRQLIDKAGDFASDDIWYRVVQFVTNNKDIHQKKGREYLDKPAIHETMVKAHQLCKISSNMFPDKGLLIVCSAPNYCYMCGNIALRLSFSDNTRRTLYESQHKT